MWKGKCTQVSQHVALCWLLSYQSTENVNLLNYCCLVSFKESTNVKSHPSRAPHPSRAACIPYKLAFFNLEYPNNQLFNRY